MFFSFSSTHCFLTSRRFLLRVSRNLWFTPSKRWMETWEARCLRRSRAAACCWRLDVRLPSTKRGWDGDDAGWCRSGILWHCSDVSAWRLLCLAEEQTTCQHHTLDKSCPPTSVANHPSSRGSQVLCHSSVWGPTKFFAIEICHSFGRYNCFSCPWHMAQTSIALSSWQQGVSGPYAPSPSWDLGTGCLPWTAWPHELCCGAGGRQESPKWLQCKRDFSSQTSSMPYYANWSTLMMFAFVTIVQKNLNPSKLFEDAPTSFACKCLHMCHMLWKQTQRDKQVDHAHLFCHHVRSSKLLPLYKYNSPSNVLR